MKKILLIGAIFALSGCSTVTQVYDSYFMAKYDTNEYALVNAIKTKAELAQEHCGNPIMIQSDVADLYAKSLEFKNFTARIPRNKDATNMSAKLFDVVKDTKEYYAKTEKVSEFYCKMKFQQIAKASDTIQVTLGSKPR